MLGSEELLSEAESCHAPGNTRLFIKLTSMYLGRQVGSPSHRSSFKASLHPKRMHHRAQGDGGSLPGEVGLR